MYYYIFPSKRFLTNTFTLSLC